MDHNPRLTNQASEYNQAHTPAMSYHRSSYSTLEGWQGPAASSSASSSRQTPARSEIRRASDSRVWSTQGLNLAPFTGPGSGSSSNSAGDQYAFPLTLNQHPPQPYLRAHYPPSNQLGVSAPPQHQNHAQFVYFPLHFNQLVVPTTNLPTHLSVPASSLGYGVPPQTGYLQSQSLDPANSIPQVHNQFSTVPTWNQFALPVQSSISFPPPTSPHTQIHPHHPIPSLPLASVPQAPTLPTQPNSLISDLVNSAYTQPSTSPFRPLELALPSPAVSTPKVADSPRISLVGSEEQERSPLAHVFDDSTPEAGTSTMIEPPVSIPQAENTDHPQTDYSDSLHLHTGCPVTHSPSSNTWNDFTAPTPDRPSIHLVPPTPLQDPAPRPSIALPQAPTAPTFPLAQLPFPLAEYAARQPTPLHQAWSPVQPSPAVTDPAFDDPSNGTWVGPGYQDWTPLDPSLDSATPLVPCSPSGVADQPGPSTAANESLFSPMRGTVAPPAANRRKAGRPKAVRPACCDKPPKTQYKRHIMFHCPNRSNAEVPKCRYCGQAFASGRKDNVKRHEEGCKGRSRLRR
ncbi:hypothetical protein FRB90_007711 [Tulasnella sp. 427]|nr:hypothetical protein FRB90_007711 [Tulasnella sp. 427]